jgi:hypothetical protein
MFRQDYRINKIFLPFQPVSRKRGRKAKKCNPSSREEIYCKLSSFSKSGNGRSSLLFSPPAGLNFLPSIREGRNTKKIHKILLCLVKFFVENKPAKLN